ncbi:MAG: hypothetical protein JW763_07045 [candidate division Zixibacteria bacterium]|nr:hypothetical protein [candidate division Zixibacteria bacterium]
MTEKHLDRQKSMAFVKPFENGTRLSRYQSGAQKAGRQFGWYNGTEYQNRFAIDLYRFLRDSIPLLGSCIWTWSRLTAAPGRYEILDCHAEEEKSGALKTLDRMSLRLDPSRHHRNGGLESFLPTLCDGLFTDGAFAGFLQVLPDMSGVDRFSPIDPAHLAVVSTKTGTKLVLQTESGKMPLDSDDFYYLGLNTDLKSGLGKSILRTIPFVAHIEQQLIDDMRRTMHNAGYHRLHVKITPPEKLSGESDDAYITRINEYFDQTVRMVKGCEPEDNPVTWDNVTIDHIGPDSARTVSNSWSLSHRAMVEEICAGTNLSPFMLGFTYSAIQNWAKFKYDLVMRQVQSVQRQVARFLEWIGNVELALRGYSGRCRYGFDNSLTYLATEQSQLRQADIDNLIKLYSNGLIDRKTASQKAGELL